MHAAKEIFRGARHAVLVEAAGIEDAVGKGQVAVFVSHGCSLLLKGCLRLTLQQKKKRIVNFASKGLHLFG